MGKTANWCLPCLLLLAVSAQNFSFYVCGTRETHNFLDAQNPVTSTNISAMLTWHRISSVPFGRIVLDGIISWHCRNTSMEWISCNDVLWLWSGDIFPAKVSRVCQTGFGSSHHDPHLTTDARSLAEGCLKTDHGGCTILHLVLNKEYPGIAHFM